MHIKRWQGLPRWHSCKEFVCQMQEMQINPWVRKILGSNPADKTKAANTSYHRTEWQWAPLPADLILSSAWECNEMHWSLLCCLWSLRDSPYSTLLHRLLQCPAHQQVWECPCHRGCIYSSFFTYFWLHWVVLAVCKLFLVQWVGIAL